MEVVLTVEQFLQDFPEFSGVDTDVISAYIRRSELFLAPFDNYIMTQKQRLLMLELMTAHLLTVSPQQTSGSSTSSSSSIGGFVQSAHIHDVSVSVTTPNTSDNLEYWLSTSTYGLQLLAFVASFPSVDYQGGSPVRVLS